MVEMVLDLCFLGLAAAVFICWEGPGTAEVQGVFGCQPNTEVLLLSVLHQSGGCSWMSSSFIAVKCQNAMNDKSSGFALPGALLILRWRLTTLRTIVPVSVCNEGVASTRFQSKASFSLP